MSRPPFETPRQLSGFTLVELAIVLVIIGLIIGGVLVGKDMIEAAKAQSLITQITKYNQAANTFRLKYDYLPGDIPDPAASKFGFATRGTVAGEGDGNGLIEGITAYQVGPVNDGSQQGEPTQFWVDLSAVNLVDGTYSGATPIGFPCLCDILPPSLPHFLPQAKLGQGNYIYVIAYQGTNYYSVTALSEIGDYGYPVSTPAMTVMQAAAIDKKLDDGFPQTGNVIALYLAPYVTYNWAAGGGGTGTADTSATPASATTCFDNGNVAGATQHYSINQNNGSGMNCALSFRLQ